MKHILTGLLLLLASLLLTAPLSAQVEVRLEPDRKQYLIGEPVLLKFTIANHTDRVLDFRNNPGNPWLRFKVTSSASPYPLSPIAIQKFPRVTLNPGQQRSYKLDIRAGYNFNMDGIYKAIAIVTMPDQRSAYTSNAATFNMSSGGALRTFNIQSGGQPLEMHVKHMSVDGKNCLFGQVTQQNSRRAIGACYLGRYLNFMEPRIRIDSRQNLHVLCQSTPEIFTYSVMNNKGKRTAMQFYKRSGGPVDLISTGGRIITMGLVPYVKPKPDEEGVHKLSEDPA